LKDVRQTNITLRQSAHEHTVSDVLVAPNDPACRNSQAITVTRACAPSIPPHARARAGRGGREETVKHNAATIIVKFSHPFAPETHVAAQPAARLKPTLSRDASKTKRSAQYFRTCGAA